MHNSAYQAYFQMRFFFDGGWDFASDPTGTGGAYSSPSDSFGWIRGRLREKDSGKGEEMGRRGREGCGTCSKGQAVWGIVWIDACPGLTDTV